MTESASPVPSSGHPPPTGDSAPATPVLLLPLLVAVSTVVAAGLLTVTGHASADLLAVAVALAGAVLSWGWPGTLSVPSPRGSTAVLLLGTAAVVLTVALESEPPYLELLPVAMAGGVLACFVHQLARRDGRPRLVESIASTVTGLAVIASGACTIALPHLEDGPWLLTAGMAAVAVSAVVDLLGRWPALLVWSLPIGMVLGAAAAVAAGQAGGVDWPPALVLGVAGAGVSHAVRRVLSVLPTLAGARPQLVSGTASVLLTGVLVVVVQRAFAG